MNVHTTVFQGLEDDALTFRVTIAMAPDAFVALTPEQRRGILDGIQAMTLAGLRADEATSPTGAP